MSMWTELGRLIRAWWSGDRIRVSPVEGRLLRLQAGDVVVVRGLSVRIRARHERPDPLRPAVIYDCVAATGTARLAVLADGRGESVRAEWSITDDDEPPTVYAIDPREVEAFARAKE